MDDPRGMPDEYLLDTIERLAREDRERMPLFISCLGEIDRRKLHDRRGYTSTFDYCVRLLHFSEDEAYRRIAAARAAVARPELLSAMAEGQLSLTAVSRIAPLVRRPDAPEIIARAEGKSSREPEEMLAPYSPEAARPDRIRSVVVVVPSESGATFAEIKSRVEFSFQGSPALRHAIDRATELLAHKFPFGGMDEVLYEIVQEYLKRHDPQKALEIGLLPPARGASAIASKIRREVWARDGGRCVYFGVDGSRCQSRRALEIDHVKPRALGGGDELGNLRLLCRKHNDVERRRILGEGKLSPDSSRDESGDNFADQIVFPLGS